MNIGGIISGDMDEMAHSTMKKYLGHASVILLLWRKALVEDFTKGRMVHHACALDVAWITNYPRSATQAQSVPGTEERPIKAGRSSIPQI